MTTLSPPSENWLKQVSSSPQGHRLLTPRGSRWSPHAPTPRQVVALVAHRNLPADEPSELLYGGAAGGGKSDWLLDGALEYTDVAGYAAIIFRRTFTDLALPGAIMARAKQWLGTSFWNQQEKTFTFPGTDPATTLTFAYLRNNDDVYRYQSAEFQYVGFDELTQFTEFQYTYLFSRLRRPALPCEHCMEPLPCDHHPGAGIHPDADPQTVALAKVPLRQRAATNPGGVGHGWVKKRYPVGHKTSMREGRVFVPAKLADNPHIDRKAYTASLHKLSPTLAQQLLDGDWDAFEGMAFPEFDPAIHVIPLGMEPVASTSWARFEQMDFGVANPTAWHLLTVDYDGNVIVLDEYYSVKGESTLVNEQAAEILRRRDDGPVYDEQDRAGWLTRDEDGRPINHACYGDPSIWNRNGLVTKLGDPASIGTEFADHGIRIAKANNDPRAGRLRLSELLALDPNRRAPQWVRHFESGSLGAPRYYISARCEQLISQLSEAPLLPIDSGKLNAGEVVDPDWEGPHGHAVAAARYGAMSRPRSSVEPEPVVSDPRAARILDHRARLAKTVSRGRTRINY